MDLTDARANADGIARELMADLKSGKIRFIGIDIIEARCAAVATDRLDSAEHDRFVQLTTRRVIELV